MLNNTFKKLDLNEIQLIDIREQWEWEEYHLDQAILIPKDELLMRMDEIDITKPAYLICRTWMRTWFMSKILKTYWFNIVNVEGGYVEYYNLNKEDNAD